VRLERLGCLKIPMTSSGIEPRYLLACSIVPQPTTLPHAPKSIEGCKYLQTYVYAAQRLRCEIYISSYTSIKHVLLLYVLALYESNYNVEFEYGI
jgi:hypothetical protein